jgi:hypothetical protein
MTRTAGSEEREATWIGSRHASVEAYLGGGQFEVPGQHFGNAGLQRALALAFYFAVLDRHPGGLGFVIMDDPILSLDDDHREAWSANLLRPALATTQVIVATHQRQFLNNCRGDFQPGRLVELNPRTRSRQVTWRPGDRLDRAEQLLAGAWTSAPNEMRKYREDLLITLDAYSPAAFFNVANLRLSLDGYAGLQPPNPLAGGNQDKITRRLREEKVGRVLDPGSHALTEADVTEPMVAECLQILRELDQTFRNELERLEALRLRDLRSRAIPAAAPPPSAAPTSASNPTLIPAESLRTVEGAAWSSPIRLPVIGAAAAQTRGCVVDMAELPLEAEFPAGGTVLVAGNTLDPIARAGQWALLADPGEEPCDQDLVAVIDRAGNHYLRRLWSAGDSWFLEVVNPLAGVPPVSLRKCQCAVRKLIGVSYGPNKPPGPSGKHTIEWWPRQDFPQTAFRGYSAITIDGTSLEPIAADGQLVLVAQKIAARFDRVRNGSLAVVETEDDQVGNVIKRVFPQDRTWLLTSPNPIDPRNPIALAKSNIRAVWPVHGILFAVAECASVGGD